MSDWDTHSRIHPLEIEPTPTLPLNWPEDIGFPTRSGPKIDFSLDDDAERVEVRMKCNSCQDDVLVMVTDDVSSLDLPARCRSCGAEHGIQNGTSYEFRTRTVAWRDSKAHQEWMDVPPRPPCENFATPPLMWWFTHSSKTSFVPGAHVECEPCGGGGVFEVTELDVERVGGPPGTPGTMSIAKKLCHVCQGTGFKDVPGLVSGPA